MNALVAVEVWCANLVERTFARIFPTSLEPAQVARKLVATIEGSQPRDGGAEPTTYAIRLSAQDAASLEPERELLESQWTRMAAALCARAGLGPAPVAVRLGADPSLPNGSIRIDVVPAAQQPAHLVLIVEHGMGSGTKYPLTREDGAERSIVIGRDPTCDIVVTDPRASRKHVRIDVDGAVVRFEDLGSTNGTLVDGRRSDGGALVVGQRLHVGDTTFRIGAEDAA